MKEKKLTPIRANAGLTLEFQRKLEAMIDEMSASIEYWLGAAYKANEPKTMAQDANIANVLNLVMKRLAKRWYEKFADRAKFLSDYYSMSIKDRTDASLKAAMKKAGLSVEFKTTAEIREIMTAAANENASLIKSIAQEHLADVAQLVQRSVLTGRDLGTLKKDLVERHGVTRRRAEFIARQSNNTTTAMVERARAQELGFKEAIWVHSSAGKEPRHEHMKWNGTKYNVQEGKWSEVDKMYVWPGTRFNCRCQSRIILTTTHQVSESAKKRAKK